MSGGSWLSHGGPTIGTHARLHGPGEKLFLGWLDYTEVNDGEDTARSRSARPTHDGASTRPSSCTCRTRTTTRSYNSPTPATHEWWCGRGDDLNATLTPRRPGRPTSGHRQRRRAGTTSRPDYDYLYAEVSTDGGATLDPDRARRSTARRSAGRSSRSTYRRGGQNVEFRFRYADRRRRERGRRVPRRHRDHGRQRPSFTDGVEAGASGWTADGLDASRPAPRSRRGTALLPAREPVVHRLRRHAEDRPVQLRPGRHPARLGGALPVPERHAGLARRPRVRRQQHHRSTRVAAYALPVDARARADQPTSDGALPGNRRQPFDATFGAGATDRTRACTARWARQVDRRSPRPLDARRPVPAVARSTTPSRAYSEPAPTRGTSVQVAGVGVKATVTVNDGGPSRSDVANPLPLS